LSAPYNSTFKRIEISFLTRQTSKVPLVKRPNYTRYIIVLELLEAKSSPQRVVDGLKAKGHQAVNLSIVAPVKILKRQ